MAGYCRTMLHGQLRRLLHDVPADRWLEYKVLPWGEINIIDYVDDSTFMENKFLAATYWQDLDAERKALEDGKPTPQYKAAIVKEMNEGNWVQESIRRFAGL